jgi:RimJ/RimL family protein N-acetyltransferase
MAPLPLPDPPLTDGVVALRGWRPDDASDIARMFRDDEALRWTRAPSPYRIEDARAWLGSLPAQQRRGEALALATVDAGDGSLVGSIDLRLRGEGRGEFGYVVADWARRRGVGTRMLTLYARWALRTLRVARLELLVQPGNEASLALGRRVGFIDEGLLRSHSVVRGERRDMVMMSLLPADLDERR